MARYGYTFIQPIRGNGKFCDLRAWVIGAGFFIVLYEIGFFPHADGSTAIIVFPFVLPGYFFLSIAEDLPKTGLSLTWMLAAGAQGLVIWMGFISPDFDGTYWGGQLYVGVILIWTTIFQARIVRARFVPN